MDGPGAGRSQSPARVGGNTGSGAPESGRRGHGPVVPGDSVAKIATEHDTTWVRVWQANADRPQPGGARFTDPDEIEPGWTLNIPAAAVAPTGGEQVTVQPQDTLSQIAVDHGSDPATVWSANRDRPQPGGARFTDPDEIEPGWVIRIPTPSPPTTPDPAAAATDPVQRQTTAAQVKAEQVKAEQVKARERGEGEQRAAQREITTGQRQAAAAEREAADGAAADGPGVATPSPPPAPAGSPAASPVSGGLLEQGGYRQAPVLAAAGGGVLLAALALAALVRGRRRQFRHRRPGRAIIGTPAELTGMERVLLTAGRRGAADVAWLDEALRSLVHSLSGTKDGRLPDLLAVRMGGDALELVLGSPAPQAPGPWSVDSSGLRWSIRRGDRLGYDDADREWHVAPFPTLASVGYTADGDHWLLDLEAIGSLSVGGDPRRCLDLARFLAAELSHNSWSEMLQVRLIGFGAEMSALHPERLTYAPDIDAAVTGLRIHLDAVTEVMAGAGVDVAAGRLHNIAGDTWAPQVLLVAPDAAGDRQALQDLLGATRAVHGRVAVAVVVAGGGVAAETRWQLRVDGQGVLSIPALDLDLVAEQLPASEAAQLAQLMAMAADTTDRPVPAAPGGQPWDAFADRVGALLAEVIVAPATGDRSPVRPAGTCPPRDGSVLPRPVQDYVAAAAVTPAEVRTLAPGVSDETLRRVLNADERLDEDLANWWDPAAATPKVSVLGPVDVRARGELDPQRPRRAWNVEVVTYLALRPRGATAEQVGMDLWPGEAGAHEKSKLRNAIYGARRWLGVNPRTGRDHLPANPGVAGGVYRVEDVLVDCELFRRLRIRAAARGPEGIADLRAALDLVTGVPFDRLRPGGYGWLAGAALDHDCTAMIADVSHVVATHHLTAGEPELAVAAAQVALTAGSHEDTPLLDAAGGCFALGHRAEGSAYIRRIMANYDADVEEELPSRTYEILLRRGWLPEAS